MMRGDYALPSRTWRFRLPDDRQVTYLTKEEVERFFKAIPGERARDRLLFDLIYRHGLRRLEAVRLLKRYIQGERIWIERLKGGISGEYPLHPATIRLITTFFNMENFSENPYLLTSRQSKESGHMATSTVYMHFRKYAQKANLPMNKQHVHILRHSIAVHLMNAGWGAADVQDWLGHRRITSTMIYARVSNKRREENYARIKESDEIARTEW